MSPSFFSVALFCLGALGLTACEDNTSNSPSTPPPPSENQQPGTVPSSVPLPPSRVAFWSELRFTKDCPFPDCPARGGFWVEADGSYLVGLTGARGVLSLPDLSQLIDQGNRVSEQDLTLVPTCVLLPPLVGRSSVTLDLLLPSGETYRVYELQDSIQSLCWLGDRGRVDQLVDTLDQLANTYGATE